MILASVHHPFLPLHVFAIYSVGNRMPPVKCVLSVTSKRFFESWWCHINYSTALRRWGCLSNKLLDRPKVQHFLCTRWNDYLLSFHAQQPWKARTSSLSRIHDHIQLNTPHSVGLLWTSDQSDAETSTWQHTTLTRDISMPPAGFEPAFPAIEPPHTQVLHRAATVIGNQTITPSQNPKLAITVIVIVCVQRLRVNP